MEILIKCWSETDRKMPSLYLRTIRQCKTILTSTYQMWRIGLHFQVRADLRYHVQSRALVAFLGKPEEEHCNIMGGLKLDQATKRWLLCSAETAPCFKKCSSNSEEPFANRSLSASEKSVANISDVPMSKPGPDWWIIGTIKARWSKISRTAESGPDLQPIDKTGIQVR